MREPPNQQSPGAQPPECAGGCAIVAENDRMRASVEQAAQVGAWAFRSGDRELTLSPVARDLTGLDGPATVRTVLRAVKPSDRARLRVALDGLLRQGATLDLDLVVQCHGGPRWLRVQGHRADGSVSGPRFVGSVQDDTSQRQFARESVTTERLLANASAMAGIGIWALDLATQEVTWSDEVFAIHELPIGAPPTVTDAVGFYAEAAREPLSEAMARLEQAGKPFDLELPMITARGRHIWVRTMGDLERVDGVPSRMYGTFQDVTSRRSVEQELRARERRWYMALDGASDGVWDWDLATDEVYFSPGWKALVGYEDHELPSELTVWAERVHPDDLTRAHALVRDHLEGRTEQYYCEHRLRHRDGSWRHHLGRGKVVEWAADGSPSRFVGTQVDITEQVRMREELQRAKDAAEDAVRIKADFLAVMSHEIRTPLNAILGMAQVMKGNCPNRELEESVGAIHASGDLLLSLLNDVLDLSKIEAGKLELERHPFDLRRAVDEVLELQRAVAKGRGISLALDWNEALEANVSGDAARIKQVCHNLVSNALKFDQRGSVVVRARAAGRQRAGVARVRLEVQDSGPGIDPALRPKLFQAFSQGDASTTRCFGGTGLGLAICKKLVEAMGGQIGVDSVPGAGATFWFELPLERAQRAPALDPAAAFDEDMHLGLRVLVVEDNPVNQLVARKMLSKLGCDVDMAGNGREGVEMAVQFPYDVILMDCQMPEMDGFEATRRIRALEDVYGAVPVVAMTANVLPEDRARCAEVGMVGFIGKPIRLRDLHAEIVSARAQAQAEAQALPSGQGDRETSPRNS